MNVRPKADAKIQQNFGMYGSDDLSSHPIACLIPKYDDKSAEIEIAVKAVIKPDPKGIVSHNQNYVEVYANRKLIGIFDVGLHPVTKGITSIEIEHNGVERSVSSICSFEGDEPEPFIRQDGNYATIKCETSKLP